MTDPVFPFHCKTEPVKIPAEFSDAVTAQPIDLGVRDADEHG